MWVSCCFVACWVLEFLKEKRSGYVTWIGVGDAAYTVVSNNTVCVINISGTSDVMWGVVNSYDMVRAAGSDIACIVWWGAAV